MKSPFPRSIYLEPSENLRIKLTQRQFLFKDVSKVTFNEPSCRKRFGEPASLNLVSESFIPLSFFDTEVY